MTEINLNAPGERKRIAREILNDIEAYAQATYDDGHRNHLGASVIGEDCTRKLWSTFRWLKHEVHIGRMQRLFQRGHREEAVFLELLRGVGFQVWDVQTEFLHYHPESDSYFIGPTFSPGDGLVEDVTDVPEHVALASLRGVRFANVQHRIKACSGHFGGSLDGINKPPVKYGLNEPLLCEFKTSGTGKGFEYLLEHGVKLGKPQHYDQMCIYGKHYGFRNALYMCVNKNDDTIHPEIVSLDWNRAVELEKKAEQIIFTPYAPAKISTSPAYIKCKSCHFKPICHEGETPEKNCRSCTSAVPVADGQWHCARFNNVIPQEFIPKGCAQWVTIL